MRSTPGLAALNARSAVHTQSPSLFLPFCCCRSMSDQGMERDAITYSALISALSKGRQWGLAIDVFNHMVRLCCCSSQQPTALPSVAVSIMLTLASCSMKLKGDTSPSGWLSPPEGGSLVFLWLP